MNKEKRMGPDYDDVKCCQPQECSRDPLSLTIRKKARHLRDKAHSLEKLADEFEHRRISPESEDVLWSAIFNLRD